MYTITQSGLNLDCDTKYLTQHSANVPFQFIKDDKYSEHQFAAFITYGNSEMEPQCKELKIYENNKFDIIPEALVTTRPVFISFALSKDNHSENTELLQLKIKSSNKSTGILPEEEETWQHAVTAVALQYMQMYFEENYKAKIEGMIEDNVNLQKSNVGLIEEAKTQQKVSSEQQVKINQQQTSIDTTINKVNTDIEQHNYVPIPEYDTTTGVGLKWKYKDGSIVDVPPIDIGGRTLMSGYTDPTSEIGRDYDFYCNISVDGEYAQWLFQKQDNVWKPLFKMSGQDGTDTVPVGAEYYIDYDTPIPNGYEEVDDQYPAENVILNNGTSVELDVASIKKSITDLETKINNTLTQYAKVVSDNTDGSLTIEFTLPNGEVVQTNELI